MKSIPYYEVILSPPNIELNLTEPLDQGWVKNWRNPGQSVFVNQVLLEHRHAH